MSYWGPEMGGGMRYNAKNSRREATEAVGAVVKVETTPYTTLD